MRSGDSPGGREGGRAAGGRTTPDDGDGAGGRAPGTGAGSEPARADPAFRCAWATADDDAALRALLRDAPTDGWVRLAFPREPSWFAARPLEGGEGGAVVVRGPGGRVVAMGSRSVTEAWLDGRAVRVGYLGQLRVAPGERLGRRTLARGYALVRSGRGRDELPFDLTAVVADNHRARRLLERGLPGLPRYTPLGELVTLVLPTGGRPRGRGRPGRNARISVVDAGEGAPCARTELAPGGTGGTGAGRAAVAGTSGVGTGAAVHGRGRREVEGHGSAAGARALDGFRTRLERERDRFRLAPRWTAARLRRLASGAEGPWIPLVAEEDGTVRGTLAVWDQRPLRQCVVRGYTPWLARLRPVANLGLRLARRPLLPPPGTPLSLGYLSHLSAADPGTAALLVAEGCARAARLGLERVALGLGAGRPELPLLRRRFGGHLYRSVLYAVHDSGRGEPPAVPADGLHVEVATL